MGTILMHTMQQLLAVTVVVLVALARIEGTQAKTRAPEVIRIDLMQYHHVNSPYATPHLSLRDRITVAVESSRARAEWFNWKISKSKFSSLASAPVHSNQGDYLMTVSLGTPAQTKVAIADTGSDLFWLECNCLSCFAAPDAAFNPFTSTTFNPISCTDPLCDDLPTSGCSSNSECEYEYSYGDQSTTAGILCSDVLSLGSSSSTVDFGCGERDQGTFSNTDGLVGLGRGPLSLISQLGISVFSYCLTSFYSSTSKTSALVLGDPAGGSYGYTALVFNSANPSFYYVNLEGIAVDGTPLSIPSGTFAIDSSGNGGFIFDSGTTITQLQMGAYTPLLNKVKSLIDYTTVDGSSDNLDACYHPGVASPSWPTVTFQFGGVDAVLPGDNLFLLMDNDGNYCMAIQGSPFAFGIYGNVQQQNFNIKYDIGGNQVGISGPTTC
ncbi:unnamed protein product [Calypogeia fissa]